MSAGPDVSEGQTVGLLRQQLEAALAERDEARAQQTAMTEVLEVINASYGDLEPVFAATIDKAMHLCEANFGMFARYHAPDFEIVATRNVPPLLLQGGRHVPSPPAIAGLGRLVNGESVVQFVDLPNSEIYRSGFIGATALVAVGANTAIFVALRKNDVLQGAIIMYRKENRAFNDKQIALLQTFATQAVIAMDNARLFTELKESLDRQTATAEVLETINRAQGNLQPVFDAIVAKALELCGGAFGTFATYDGQRLRTVATQGVPEAFAQYRRSNPPDYGPGTGPARLMAGEDYVHDIDAADSDSYRQGDRNRRAIVDLGGARTILNVALRKDRTLLGTISIYRQEVRPFSDGQIAMLQGFAAQAVIAMENARLLGELHESLDQQTAMADVLGLINSTTGDITPIFDAMVDKATALCDAPHGVLFSLDGEVLHAISTRHSPQDPSGFLLQPFQVPSGTNLASALSKGEATQDPDLSKSEAYRRGVPLTVFGVDQIGIRTMLMVPLVGERGSIGVFTLYRKEVRPFTDKQIALVEAFAQQAVIAMENTRLLGELTRREEELRVTFDHMGDGVVMFDAGLKLASWNRNFQELLDIPDAFVAARPGLEDYVRLLVQRGELGHGNPDEEIARYRERANEAWTAERTRPDGRIVEVRNNPVPGGGAVLIYSDITERKRAETEIAAARDAAETALERQSATADILGIIASSPTDVQPVLDAVVKAAVRYCGATDALINVRDGSEMVRMAHEGPLAATVGRRRPIARDSASARSIHDGQTIHHPDIEALDPDEFATARRQAVQYGYRAALATPMLREGTAIGNIVLRKADPGPFTAQQITLLETFAAQAVIAIENVRLFTELRSSLEQQTATADILKVIASSPTDVQPVLDAVVEAAVRFCGAPDAIVSMREGDEWLPIAHHGTLTATLNFRQRLSRASTTGRAIIDARTMHVADITLEDPEEYRETLVLARQHKWRAALVAPMLRDGLAIGSIMLRKPDPGPFAPQQIALLETFAAQAVIAIENVRLFTELRDSLDQQTATADILKVIASSPTDVQPVLDVLAKAAVRFCGATDAVIHMRDGSDAVLAAHEGPLGGRRGARVALNRESGFGAAMVDAATIHRPDIRLLDPVEFAAAHRFSRARGFLAVLAAPLLRKGTAIGAISLRRVEAGAFAPQQIELLETFAAQAVIAIENVRLFTELRDSLERLKAAQANLIQSEKMASLGQLTAGIAHEIKNPLNFVNNFAMLSVDLLDELKEVAGPALATLDEDKRAELDETMELLTGNLGKIAEHGKRADGIVKSMLSHSRGGTGDWAPSDINALVEEALNLAYHGARAQDKEFNVTLERDLEKAGKPIEVVPQDVTRVFLNLFGNGFYAANKRRLANKEAGFRPTLRVSTRDTGDGVEVRVRDNGTGIPTEIREKLFQPFFTTKPTGEGTGLGLSISYDIVTQQHGGTIEVESEPGVFTEFTVRLPRVRRVAEARGA